MEYFESRLVWTPVPNVVDPENDGNLIDQHDDDDDDGRSDMNPSPQPSTSSGYKRVQTSK